MNDDVNFNKKEVQYLRGEKETLENVLALKAQEIRKTISNEATWVEEELQRKLTQQKAENTKLQ